MNRNDLVRYIKKTEALSVLSLGTRKTHLALFEVYLNKKQLVYNKQSQRGINVVVLKEKNDKFHFESYKAYDFWEKDCNKEFRNDIKNISGQRVIIMGIKEDGNKKLNQETRKFLHQYCQSRYATSIGRHQSWALVVKKYTQERIERVAESYHPSKTARVEGTFHLTFVRPELPEMYKSVYSFDPQTIQSSPVKEKTRELKKILKKTPSIHEKFKIMENYYQGHECYIISCGPSLSNYCRNLIKRIAGEAVVMTIKQALKVYEDITDFHVLNWCNYQPYNYTNKDLISLYLSSDEKINSFHDITLSLDPKYYINRIRHHSQKIPAIARSFRFNEYLFSKKIERPEGPGIMYEIPFYLALHLGCKKITVLGWDLNYKMPPLIGNGPKYEVVENSHFYGSSNHTNRHIAKIVNENDDIVASTPILYHWLKSLGIELFIMSNQSRVDKIVPRLNPEDIYRQKITEDTTKIEDAISEIESMEKEKPKERSWLDDYMKEIDNRLQEKLNLKIKETESQFASKLIDPEPIPESNQENSKEEEINQEENQN